MRLTFDIPHYLSKLHDELLAAVPGVRPVNGQAVMSVSGDRQTLTLEVPKGADEVAIRAVVQAHDPTPPPPPVDADAELATAIEAATNLEELKSALLGKVRAGRAAARPT